MAGKGLAFLCWFGSGVINLLWLTSALANLNWCDEMSLARGLLGAFICVLSVGWILF